MKPITGLFLMLGALPGFLSQTIHVWQIPVIWATEGTSVTLPCDYNITGENTTIRSYKWYRHFVRSNIEISENDKHFSGRLSRVDSEEFIHRRSAAITLHSLEPSDSGMYYCEVTFQIGQEVSGHGDGTFLNVTASASVSVRTVNSIIIINIIRLILGVLVVLAALLICCSCRDKGDGSQCLESHQSGLKPNMASPYPNAPTLEENVTIGTDNIPSTVL